MGAKNAGKILTEFRLGLAAVICLSGCSAVETSYPLAEKIKDVSKLQYCDSKRHLYCDDGFVYPIVVVKFR